MGQRGSGETRTTGSGVWTIRSGQDRRRGTHGAEGRKEEKEKE